MVALGRQVDWPAFCRAKSQHDTHQTSESMLGVECLESRMMLSTVSGGATEIPLTDEVNFTTVVFNDDTGNLRILGTQNADNITVSTTSTTPSESEVRTR